MSAVGGEGKYPRVCHLEGNYEGSSGGMEPHGLSILFKRSLAEKIRYKYLISDGDSKSHSLILEQQP